MAKGLTVRCERDTYGIFSPEFGSAVGQGGMLTVIGAIVFGFEIESGQHEICAARLAEEAVFEAKFIERILERLHHVHLGGGKVIVVTWI